MTPLRSLTLVFAGSLLASCQPGTSSPVTDVSGAAAAPVPAAVVPASPPVPAPASPKPDTAAMSPFLAFVPAQHRLVDAVRGPLTGAGTSGAVLIVEPEPDVATKLGEAGPRQVVLVVPDSGGVLRMSAANDRIVPCATCGGVAGDPYGDTRIDAGRFTIAIGGGSRERWSADYSFVYEPATQRFVVEHVVRRVVDTMGDGKMEETSADTQDLGVMTFEDFDPAQLGDEPTLD